MLFGFCVALMACIGFVFFSIPRECRRTVRQNFRRIDGSWSPRRFRREAAAVREYVLSVIAPLLLVFLSVFAVTSYISHYVIPFDLVVDGFRAFDWDPGQWKDNLSEVRHQHTAFAESQGMTAEQTRNLQWSLWTDLPVMIVTGLLLIGISFYVVFRTAGAAVATWAAGIRQRRSQYARGDVSKMQSGTLIGRQTGSTSESIAS